MDFILAIGSNPILAVLLAIFAPLVKGMIVSLLKGVANRFKSNAAATPDKNDDVIADAVASTVDLAVNAINAGQIEQALKHLADAKEQAKKK